MTWGAPPWFNMGLDEALLLSPGAPPTLRLYSWSPDTLSLGYFQRYDDVPGSARAGAVCRRITGGGAIHHVNELTFALVTSLDDPLYRGPIGESYTRVHAGFARALAEYGVAAATRGDAALSSDREGTGMCFHRSTPFDLAWDGRKGLGSAQRRKAGRVLHHGSLKLGGSALELDVATLRAHRRGLEVGEFATAVEAALARELDLTFERGVPTEREREGAEALGPRYLDPAFVRRR